MGDGWIDMAVLIGVIMWLAAVIGGKEDPKVRSRDINEYTRRKE